jgi:hypothetical protein
MIERVAQQDEFGCVVACLAMVRGLSYETVKQEFNGYDFTRTGLRAGVWDQYLAECGFAVRRKNRHYSPGRRKWRDWPCDPFAPLHLCVVLFREGALCSHLVVMLHDGTIVDPLDSSKTRLSDYPAVFSVAGVYQVQ